MMNREKIIRECIEMIAELNGVSTDVVNVKELYRYSDNRLQREHDWLWELVYLK
jgi:hypothetical protein